MNTTFELETLLAQHAAAFARSLFINLLVPPRDGIYIVRFPLVPAQNITLSLCIHLRETEKKRPLTQQEAFILKLNDGLTAVLGYTPPITTMILLPAQQQEEEVIVDYIQRVFPEPPRQAILDSAASWVALYVNQFESLKPIIAMLSNGYIDYGIYQGAIEFWLSGSYHLRSELASSTNGLGDAMMPLFVDAMIKQQATIVVKPELTHGSILTALRSSMEYFGWWCLVAAVEPKDTLLRDLVMMVSEGQGYAVFLTLLWSRTLDRDYDGEVSEEYVHYVIAAGTVANKLGGPATVLDSLTIERSREPDEDKEQYRLEMKRLSQLGLRWAGYMLYASMIADLKEAKRLKMHKSRVVDGEWTVAILHRFNIKLMLPHLIQMATIFGRKRALLHLEDRFGCNIRQFTFRPGSDEMDEPEDEEERMGVIAFAGTLTPQANIDRTSMVRSLMKRGAVLPTADQMQSWEDTSLVALVNKHFNSPSSSNN